MPNEPINISAASLMAEMPALLAAINTAEDSGITGVILAYAAAGVRIDDAYAALAREASKAPVVSAKRQWSDVVAILPWDGKGGTRSLWGKSESTLQRVWKVGHYTTDTRGPGQWLLACTRAATATMAGTKLPDTDVRGDSAYVRTRITAYVRWVTAKAEGRITKTGSITDAVRTTGAAGSAQTGAATRKARIEAAADSVATAAKSDASMEVRTRPLKLADVTTTITAEQVSSLSTAALRELAQVITAELKRRDAVDETAKVSADAAAEAAALAAEAAAVSGKGKGKRLKVA